jgi:glycolate oxidase FAD binding subunit
MTAELFHPRTPADVVEIVRGASADRRTLLPVGGRAHIDRGNPTEPDGELWTTQLDGIVAYEPAEMLVVVEAGMRCGDLATALAEHDQEWPVDAPAEATVGGVIAAGASSFRRRRVGHVRDTVVEMTTVTGDGRTITSGARTVKNVSGFDVQRLMTGSLGTLGVIVQAALKIRPLPRARAVLRASADDAMALADQLATAVPQAAAVVASLGAVTLHVEGWPDEVSELKIMAGSLTSLEAVDGPEGPPLPEATTVVEVAVVPSRLPEVLARHDRWVALAGVGIALVGLSGPEELATLRAAVDEAGGIAPAIRGPGGLGSSAVPAPEVHHRLKAAFDPHGVLAPGRFWNGG